MSLFFTIENITFSFVSGLDDVKFEAAGVWPITNPDCSFFALFSSFGSAVFAHHHPFGMPLMPLTAGQSTDASAAGGQSKGNPRRIASPTVGLSVTGPDAFC